ncbi:hypothetical protein NLI96_g4487 [Meripilus lineatus]|uniref:Uncharacterized protein n=1 Tax=Meripilus lineatus TaxID=2056292 RepID=A0AAD5V700_9APHY|nr:hypothetical protein NLI96_g4487 [Physisporinus lineatus]
MSYKAQKRKYKHFNPRDNDNHDHDEGAAAESSHASLYIQAHEADIVRGAQALAAAHSLEIERDTNGKEVRIGSALIQWGYHSDQGSENATGTWIDRYDARLLLDELPTAGVKPHTADRLSPTGWSDLPSDTEDTFFFQPDEAEDFRREKRRKLIDQSREERLRALRAEDDPELPPEEVWGGSDEEPDEAQKELMRRTAAHVTSSPNPAQLEMRILANYGADQRFAFLRGRWSRTWRTMKTRLLKEKEQEQTKQEGGNSGLGGLTGYGESDDESSQADPEDEPPEHPQKDAEPTLDHVVADETAKEARRERARRWAEERRAKRAEGNE